MKLLTRAEHDLLSRVRAVCDLPDGGELSGSARILEQLVQQGRIVVAREDENCAYGNITPSGREELKLYALLLECGLVQP